MSTFTKDLSTDIGKVRLYLQDNAEGTNAFTDEEITVFLEAAGGWRPAIAEAAKVLLMNGARRARLFTDPEGNTVDETTGLTFLQDLIATYGGGASTLQRVTVTSLGRHPHTPR